MKIKRKSRIVVIDDDPSFGPLLSLIAANHGLIIKCGASLDQIDRAALDQADLLVIDYHLDDETGVELGRRLEERQVNTPIVLASQDALKLGDWPGNIRSFAAKSLGPYGVLDLIRSVLPAA